MNHLNHNHHHHHQQQQQQQQHPATRGGRARLLGAPAEASESWPRSPPTSSPLLNRLCQKRSNKQRDHFFLLVATLFQILSESGNHSLRSQAKMAVQVCIQGNRARDPQFTSLIESTTKVLKMIVGNRYWTQAELRVRARTATGVLPERLMLPPPPRNSTLQRFASNSTRPRLSSQMTGIFPTSEVLPAANRIVNQSLGHMGAFTWHHEEEEEQRKLVREQPQPVDHKIMFDDSSSYLFRQRTEAHQLAKQKKDIHKL